jgi:hypothetical protein
MMRRSHGFLRPGSSFHNQLKKAIVSRHSALGHVEVLSRPMRGA